MPSNSSAGDKARLLPAIIPVADILWTQPHGRRFTNPCKIFRQTQDALPRLDPDRQFSLDTSRGRATMSWRAGSSLVRPGGVQTMRGSGLSRWFLASTLLAFLALAS